MERILLVAESPVKTEYIRSILESDYEIDVCRSAAESLECARTGNHSLILLGIALRDMDGFELLCMLHESEATKCIPVILITGFDDTAHEAHGLELGAADYITIPFDPAILKARINNHIRIYHEQMRCQEAAMLDNLTGIANRRGYDRGSLQRWREAVRLKQPFSIVMIDVDHFKLYNDTFGHQSGDKVLIDVAHCLSDHLQRATDFLARYGGEEFVAILIGDDAKSAFERMKSIRHAVESMQIPSVSPVCPWVTISIGGISFTPHFGDSYASNLCVADQMLYQAKEHGRNRVVWLNGASEHWIEEP